jgi:hypothetical protein
MVFLEKKRVKGHKETQVKVCEWAKLKTTTKNSLWWKTKCGISGSMLIKVMVGKRWKKA